MKKLMLFMFALMFGIAVNAQKVTDAEGNVYKTVKIGKQVWMASNLRATKFWDSTDIPLVTDNTAWRSLTTPGYCLYENDQTKFGVVYGALYNWHAVNAGKLCPKGWHVPGDAEWKTLSDLLGGGEGAGNKLKEAGSRHWNAPNAGATNETGWTALPAGRRNAGGEFSGIGELSYFWSATASGDAKAFYRGIGNADPTIDRYAYNSESGFAVRCVQD
jgi:uncharacterized protein (TIGR02145 family)